MPYIFCKMIQFHLIPRKSILQAWHCQLSKMCSCLITMDSGLDPSKMYTGDWALFSEKFCSWKSRKEFAITLWKIAGMGCKRLCKVTSIFSEAQLPSSSHKWISITKLIHYAGNKSSQQKCWHHLRNGSKTACAVAAQIRLCSSQEHLDNLVWVLWLVFCSCMLELNRTNRTGVFCKGLVITLHRGMLLKQNQPGCE